MKRLALNNVVLVQGHTEDSLLLDLDHFETILIGQKLFDSL